MKNYLFPLFYVCVFSYSHNTHTYIYFYFNMLTFLECFTMKGRLCNRAYNNLPNGVSALKVCVCVYMFIHVYKYMHTHTNI